MTVVVILFVVVCILSGTKSQEDSSTLANGMSGQSAAAEPTSSSLSSGGDEKLVPVESVAAPAETRQVQASPASRDRIAAATTEKEVRELHRILSAELMDVLENLVTIEDEDRITVATQELADRFYLLDRVVQARGLPTPGAGSVRLDDADRLERLLRVWQENMPLALTVDRLFSERDILVDEHVSQALRRWMDDGIPK